MTQERRIPEPVLQKLALLQTATRVMPTLEEEIRFLQLRLSNSDMAAAYLGLRSTAEAMLRHAARAEGLKVNGDGVLRDLKQALEPVRKLDKTFWVHMAPVQAFGNQYAHSQSDDGDHQAGFRKAQDPWSDVELCLAHLAAMAKELVEHWPPPTPPVILDEVAEEADETPESEVTIPESEMDVTALGDLNAKQAGRAPPRAPPSRS